MSVTQNRFARLSLWAQTALLGMVTLILLFLPEVISFLVLYVGDKLLDRPGWSSAYRNAWDRDRWESSTKISQFQYDPYRLYGYRPNVAFWGCTTDKHGFLHNGDPDAFDPSHKPLETFRIFLLGGSTTAAFHAGSNTLTIAAQLERKLNNDDVLKRRYGVQRFEVINAAVSGYTSTQEFLFLSLELIRYSPDMVILLDGYNEWGASILRNWKPHASIRSQELEQGFESTVALGSSFLQSIRLLRDKIVERARLLYKYTDVLSSVAWNKLLRESGQRLGKYDDERRTIRSLSNRASIEIYRDNLRNVAALCRSRGIRCMLILQPTFGIEKEYLSEVERFILKEYGYALAHKRAYFRELRNLFAGFRDADGRIVSAHDFTEIFREVQDQIYIDFAHYTQLGNEILAERIQGIL